MAGDWRERKKARTKEAIQGAALRLFMAQGFEETTVAQIAAAAGVSHMTFFRYFPAKEDVVISDDFDPVLEKLVRGTPPEEPPVRRVQLAVAEGLRAVYPAYREELLARIRLMLSTPALRGGLWDNFVGAQRLLERSLSGGNDAEQAPLRIRVAAGACVAALTTTIVDWAQSEAPGDLPAMVDAAFIALRQELG